MTDTVSLMFLSFLAGVVVGLLLRPAPSTEKKAPAKKAEPKGPPPAVFYCRECGAYYPAGHGHKKPEPKRKPSFWRVRG